MSLTIQAARGEAELGGLVLPCRIGKEGCVDQSAGREGDAKTPLGEYHLRFGLYRADRLPTPKSSLTFWPIETNDGWCDDPDGDAYNRFIRLPSTASHEALWREDGAYDIILVISHNDSPPEPHKGSAIFLHIAQPDDRQTLGCVAFAPDDMVAMLPLLTPDMAVRIIR
ncbi:L,D-transpeptidase [Litorimonas sp. RW-G-Af-16]|uniref:L,D-transpeptidase family protein n=1 Tax=Litorimonas sp. RW-G-Af-16 TaxID=3241168 RepID=UPI003AACFA0B